MHKIGQVLRNCWRVLDNTVGEYIWKQPKICTIDETLRYIIEEKCSVSRYGDGELNLMVGYGNGFQDHDDILQRRLIDIIRTPIEGHIVCLPAIFTKEDRSILISKSIKYNEELLKKRRNSWMKHIDLSRIYYNTNFTRPYYMFRDKSNSERWFNQIKLIWNGKKVLIVEGEKTRLGIGNDLFRGCSDISRILCPADNAFLVYDRILSECVRIGGGYDLILIALGMTATVLAYDLARSGFRAIDVGHIDIEYEWFLRKVDERCAIEGKYVNEVKGGSNVSDTIVTDEYRKQIIKRIDL